MYFYNDNERVSLLISLLLSPDYDFTIEKAAQDLDLARGLIRSDVAAIATFLGCITLGNASCKDTAEEIKAGNLDAELIKIESEELLMDGYYIASSVHEYPYIKEWLDNTDAIYHVKGIYKKNTKNIKRYFPILEDAAASEYPVEFDYYMDGQLLKNQRCVPLMLRISSVYTADSKCISRDGRVFSISEMKNIRKITGYTEEMANNVPEWSLLWGGNVGSGEEPFHIRLEINPNTKNLLNKVKADIANRKNGQLIEAENLYIYDDDVLGKDAFIEWLRRYGSSIKVIEPEWLANEIIADNLKAERQYASGRFE